MKISDAAVILKMYFKSTAKFFFMQLMGEVQLLHSQSECLDACLPSLEDFSAYLKDYPKLHYTFF